jgi:hypothetical protein
VEKISKVIMFLFLVSCGRPGEKPKASPDLKAWLTAKQKTYRDLIKDSQDEFGFIDHKHCDSLLFTGLTYIDSYFEVNIEAARDDNGQWYRRSTTKPCYPTGSKSTISRDMFMGLLWHIWRNQRLDLAEDLYEYGVKNNWIMGEGDIGRIYFSPGLQGTLAEIIYQLGGENHLTVRSIPQVYSKNDGFAAHLDVLHILLRGELKGSVANSDLELLKYHRDRSPNNSLFQYAYHKYTDGDMDDAIVPLLKEKWFPADRLPSKSDRRESWLWQRDEGEDWTPSESSTEEHHGGDLLFVAYLILSEL